MAKILISDLFGTLIPDTITQAHHLYAKGSLDRDFNEICDDKEYHKYLMDKISEQCINTLDKFLEEGNTLFIVSDLSGHDTGADFVLQEIIGRFHKYSDNQFQIYFVTTGGTCGFHIDKLKDKITKEYTENGVNYIVYDGYPVGLLEKKEDVFKVIENRFDLNDYNLYSLGNTSEDVSMIIKCMELGGRGTLLNYVLYSNQNLSNITIDNAIAKRVSHEQYLLKEQRMLENFPEFSQKDNKERRYLKDKFIYRWDDEAFQEQESNLRKNRMLELYNELRNGNISLDQLIKEDLVFNIIKHASRHYLKNKTLTENNWDKIDMYSTFRNYYNRVLSYDSKKPEKDPQFVKVQKQSDED